MAVHAAHKHTRGQPTHTESDLHHKRVQQVSHQAGGQELSREIRALLRGDTGGQLCGGERRQVKRVLSQQDQAAAIQGHVRVGHGPPLLQQRGG